MHTPHDDDRDREPDAQNEHETCEGRAFPSEAEWLDLPPPPFAEDFVARTMAALQQDREPVSEIAGHLLTAPQLAAFTAPEPSADFVARTLRAIQDDRRARWQELLAKYVSPEPSPEFVAQTLRALAADRPSGALHGDPQGWTPSGPRTVWRRRWLPLLAAITTIAASVAVIVHWVEPSPPFEQQLADAVRPSFAHGYAATPLPAVLGSLERAASPEALPAGGADGMWILLHRKPR